MAAVQVALVDGHLRLLRLRRHLGLGLLLRRLHHLLLVHLHVAHVLLVLLVHHVTTTVALHLLVVHATSNLALATREALLLVRAHLAAHATAVLLLLHEEGHGLEEHLEVVLHLLLVGKIGPLGILRVLLAEDLKVVFVARGLILKLANLLDLVVVDRQGLVIDGEAFLGTGRLIRLLEADKGVELLSVVARRVHLEGLDLTVAGEEVAELILSHGRRETLHIQVAPLLGALVFDGLAKTLSLAISTLKCFFHIKLFVIGQGNAIDH